MINGSVREERDYSYKTTTTRTTINNNDNKKTKNKQQQQQQNGERTDGLPLCKEPFQ